MDKKEKYSVWEDDRGDYWIEDNRTAITGPLFDIVAIEDAQLFCNALNALHKILEEIPAKAKLPLVLKIKSLAQKGLK
jgi:hypothetical protein